MIVKPRRRYKGYYVSQPFLLRSDGYVIRLATTEKKTDVTKRGNRQQATVSWENEKREQIVT